MRIAVTGAAGFLGSHLCERLLRSGHEAVGIDAFTANYARSLKEANVGALRDAPGFSLLERDILAPALADALEGCEAILHLAGRPGVRERNAALHERANVGGTAALMRAAGAASVRRVVLASSSSVYGPARGPVAENVPLRPISAYGASKRGAERVARTVALRSGIEVVILRYFTLYGPRQRPDMAFARFAGAALHGRPVPLHGDGRQRRDFTFVEDAVRATLLALERGRAGAVYNVAGGSPASLNEALALVARAVGAEPRLQRRPADPREPRSTAADLSAARRDLGWSPAVGLEDGIAAQIAAATSAYTLAV